MYNPTSVRPLVLILILACLPLLSGISRAADIPQEETLAKLQQVYRGFTSLRFDFTQLTRTQVRARTGRGTAVFLRAEKPEQPGIMRWDYTEPDRQIIVNDGEKLFMYTAGDHQLLITSARELNDDITYSFFSGKHNITDVFIPQPPDTRFSFELAGTTLHVMRLLPRKPSPRIKAVQIWFDDNYLIRHLLLEDPFDTITQLDFTNIQTNTLDIHDPKVREKILKLDIPKDTEILRR